MRRGDIYLVDLEPVRGSEQGEVRPCLVIQNDFGNKYSPVIIVAPITSKKFSKEFLTNVSILKKESRLPRDSNVLLNQITTIDKSRILKKIGSLDSSIMKKVDLAIKLSLGLS